MIYVKQFMNTKHTIKMSIIRKSWTTDVDTGKQAGQSVPPAPLNETTLSLSCFNLEILQQFSIPNNGCFLYFVLLQKKLVVAASADLNENTYYCSYGSRAVEIWDI